MTLEELKKYKHIHLIGIGGISMSAIAETLLNWNFKVTGSDSTQTEITDRLLNHGIEVTIGHASPVTFPVNGTCILTGTADEIGIGHLSAIIAPI